MNLISLLSLRVNVILQTETAGLPLFGRAAEGKVIKSALTGSGAMAHSWTASLGKLWKEMQSYTTHEFHEHPSFKFAIVLLVLTLYTLFTAHKFGAREGLLISALTWSFFVLCTPVADAGILLDLPVRLITGIRMVYSELAVWVIAISLNIIVTLVAPQVYSTTILLSLLSSIIHHPFPYWLIILLAAAGTFLSIIFGDEILDITSQQKSSRDHHSRHHMKHRLLATILLIILTLLLYDILLNNLGVSVPLF